MMIRWYFCTLYEARSPRLLKNHVLLPDKAGKQSIYVLSLLFANMEFSNKVIVRLLGASDINKIYKCLKYLSVNNV